MMSVNITELIWQAKTWEKSNQEVGNLRFVGFQVLAYPINSVCGVILHFLKKTLRKRLNLRTALRTQNSQRNSRHFGINKVTNNTINIHLPLIFIRMHSQQSQFHDKSLICSIMSIYVQIAAFVSAFGKQIQTRVQVQPNVRRKVQKVPLQPVESCQTKYKMFLS